MPVKGALQFTDGQVSAVTARRYYNWTPLKLGAVTIGRHNSAQPTIRRQSNFGANSYLLKGSTAIYGLAIKSVYKYTLLQLDDVTTGRNYNLTPLELDDFTTGRRYHRALLQTVLISTGPIFFLL